MFGFFKSGRTPQGPFTFVASVEIERPVEHVYALIDLADERHAKRQLGERVEEVEGRPGTYRMFIGALPDLEFELTLTERVPGASIAFDCKITPSVGRLAASHELYRLEALDAQSCRLDLTNTVTFLGELRDDALQEEALNMTVSLHNALAKLKLHAEGGVDAVRAVEQDLVVGLKCAGLDET